jgi:hypothetical protein
MGRWAALTWNGSWDDALDNPSAVGAVSAMIRVISAADALGAWGRTSCKRQVIDSDLGGQGDSKIAN